MEVNFLIVPIRLFWHFLIALPVVSSLNFYLTTPFYVVLKLHFCVFVVLLTFSNKHRIGTAALIRGRSLFWARIKIFAYFLTQMRCLFE